MCSSAIDAGCRIQDSSYTFLSCRWKGLFCHKKYHNMIIGYRPFMYETFTSARIQFPTTTKICGKNIHKRAWLTIWSLFQLEILQSCSFVSVFLLVVNVTCNCNSNTYHHQHYFSLNFCKQDKRERRKKLFFLVPQNEDKKVVQVRILLLISLLVLQFQPTSSSLGIQKNPILLYWLNYSLHEICMYE